jgi:ribonuclease HII
LRTSQRDSRKQSGVVLNKPSFAEEQKLRKEGYAYIAGVDEVGRGALAGPVVAAAVILPHSVKGNWRKQVRDSKQLTPARRDSLFHQIHQIAIAIGIGMAACQTIDTKGIAVATRLSMKSAVEQLSPAADMLLIDYFRIPEVSLPQKGLPGGDSLCFSIACASIIAKVTRDRIMAELDKDYPGYGLAKHKGYGTRAHLDCLVRLGPCPVHRRSFKLTRSVPE